MRTYHSLTSNSLQSTAYVHKYFPTVKDSNAGSNHFLNGFNRFCEKMEHINNVIKRSFGFLEDQEQRSRVQLAN